jgi:hypothetical protein
MNAKASIRGWRAPPAALVTLNLSGLALQLTAHARRPWGASAVAKMHFSNSHGVAGTFGAVPILESPSLMGDSEVASARLDV